MMLRQESYPFSLELGRRISGTIHEHATSNQPRDDSLLQPSIEAAQNDRRNVVQVNLRHARERRVVPRDVRMQEIVQLGGELDPGRPSADDAEVEQLSPVGVGDRRLVRLLEACSNLVSSSKWMMLGGGLTLEDSRPNSPGVPDVFEEVRVFLNAWYVERCTKG